MTRDGKVWEIAETVNACGCAVLVLVLSFSPVVLWGLILWKVW